MTRSRMRRWLILLLLLLVLASVIGYATTVSRYAASVDPTNHSGELTFSVVDQIEVFSVEEFFSAIENGYSNIKISETVENPLFINHDEMSLTSDLILDLNGHDIQRNNREPMLSIKEGVKMVVIDSSKSGSGSFYNPVGSVLSVDGGTLTVASGRFESGVRPSEYYSARTESTYTGGLITQNDTPVTVYRKVGNSYTTSTVYHMPLLRPVAYLTGTDAMGKNVCTSNGNVYFDTVSGLTSLASLSAYITEDTYLYCVIDGEMNTIAPTAGADFYYAYDVYRTVDETTGVPSYDLTGGDEKVSVTVYGYHDVMAMARNEGDLSQETLGREKSNFAAIKMRSGDLYTQGGSYYSNFGVSSAYAVYVIGGDMRVSGGYFEAAEYGTCVNCSFDNSAEAGTLTIANGDFKSYLGDTIQMNSGEMYVTGGRFIKDSTAAAVNSPVRSNNAAINLYGGKLYVTGPSDRSCIPFSISGSGVTAIDCGMDSELVIENVSFVFNEFGTGYQNNVGIFSEGGIIQAKSCLFFMTDDNDTGIRSISSPEGTPGMVSLRSSIFSMSGKSARGVDIESGTIELGYRSDIDEYVLFFIEHVTDCYGIYARSREADSNLVIRANSARFMMGQTHYASEREGIVTTGGAIERTQGAGIYLDAAGGEVYLGRVSFMSAGSYVSGVLLKQGELKNSPLPDDVTHLFIGTSFTGYPTGGYYVGEPAGTNYIEQFGQKWFYIPWADTADTASAHLQSSDAIGSYGIASLGGRIDAQELVIDLRSTFAAGVYGTGGNILVEYLKATIDTSDNTSKTLNGVTYDISSAALYAQGGAVIVRESNVVTDGYGCYVNGGNLYFGYKEPQERIFENMLSAERSTLLFVSDGSITVGEDTLLTFAGQISDGSGRDFFIGGTGYPHGIVVQGGSLLCDGEIDFRFTGLDNDNRYWNDPYRPQDMKSWAIYVSGDALTEVRFRRGLVTNAVGGGVYVNGGSVTLGTEGGTDDFTVSTTGSSNYTYNQYTGSGIGNWGYFYSRTGGNAVQCVGGDLTVYSGTYTAEIGNGITVCGGTATVYNGHFRGHNNDPNNVPNGTWGNGLCSYYGLQMYDGGTFTSYGGMFEGYNGGAFVHGSVLQNATANIHGGTFTYLQGFGPSASGFCIGFYADVLFDDSPLTAAPVSVNGYTCAIAVETNGSLGTSYDTVTLTIRKGTFEATQGGTYPDVIWNGNTSATIRLGGGTYICTEGGLLPGYGGDVACEPGYVLYRLRPDGTYEISTIWASYMGGTYVVATTYPDPA